MQPPDGPPVCTALILPPSGAPPPISSTICRSVVPIGTSTRPVLRILPASAKTFVPLLFSVPIAANQSAPVADDRRDVGEGLDVVDQRRDCPRGPPRPGYGGRGRGVPRWPSIEAISAVSSPQTNAPAPIRRSIRKLNGDSKIWLPSSPSRLRLLIAGLAAGGSPADTRRGRRCSPGRRRPRRRRWPCPRARGADRSPARCGP